MLCHSLEGLVIHIRPWSRIHVEHPVATVESRASRGVGLSSITITGQGDLVAEKDVFKLREHVTRVEHLLPGLVFLTGDNDESECVWETLYRSDVLDQWTNFFVDNEQLIFASSHCFRRA